MTTPHKVSADHVSDDEAEAVAQFAADVGALLHLPRYRFMVMDDPSDSGSIASIKTLEHRWVAELYLSSEWMEFSSDTRMNAVIHEVCHLLHRNIDHIMDDELESYLHEYEHNRIGMRYTREVELMVDHIAMFITDFTTVKQTWAKLHRKKK